MPIAIRISHHFLPRKLEDSSQNLSKLSQFHYLSSIKPPPAAATSIDYKIHVITRRQFKSTTTFAASVNEGPLKQQLDDDDSLFPIQLESISSESQFDRVIDESQQLDQPVIILWMASWCRKCIYLKPKLEKLAIEYHPSLPVKAVFFIGGECNGKWAMLTGHLRNGMTSITGLLYPIDNATFCKLRFYCVDVNAVPHKLVSRAGVTKMPTIQLWNDGKKQAEVIGGHKAYLVINEVRAMIESVDEL